MSSISIQSITETDGSRIAWADLCRVVAIFGVILIHACGILLNSSHFPSYLDWLTAANWLDSLVRCSVPLFVMLSGALLLRPGNRQIVLTQLMRRVAKVLFPLISWNIFYLAYLSHYTGQPIQWFSMLVKLPMYHLWYVYMIIGLYLLMPIFQAIYQYILDRQDLQIYLFILWFIVTAVPIYSPLPILPIMQIQGLLGYGGYFLIGAIIAASPDKKISHFWLLLFGMSVSATAILTSHFSNLAGQLVETAYVYFSPNVVVASIAAFVILLKTRVAPRYVKTIEKISDLSFIVFFIHVVVVDKVASSHFIGNISSMVPGFILILIIGGTTFFISLAIAAAIRFLPGSRRVFG